MFASVSFMALIVMLKIKKTKLLLLWDHLVLPQQKENGHLYSNFISDYEGPRKLFLLNPNLFEPKKN